MQLPLFVLPAERNLLMLSNQFIFCYTMAFESERPKVWQDLLFKIEEAARKQAKHLGRDNIRGWGKSKVVTF